ncbi:MAG: hypothetical protein ACPGVB_14930 [Chitinophagales bacterium]
MKKVVIFLLIGLGFFGASSAWAQQSNPKTEAVFEVLRQDSSLIINQFGMNLSPLLLQLIPLNRGTRLTGPYGFSYNRVNTKNRMFRLGLGVFIDDDFFGESHLNLRIGFGKLRKISKKWHLTTGWDFIAFAGSLNIPNENNNFEDAGIGFGPVMGLQFYPTPNISLGTESFLFIGTTDSSPVALRVIPPLAVFIHINFTSISPKSIREARRTERNQQKMEQKE